METAIRTFGAAGHSATWCPHAGAKSSPRREPRMKGGPQRRTDVFWLHGLGLDQNHHWTLGVSRPFSCRDLCLISSRPAHFGICCYICITWRGSVSSLLHRPHSQNPKCTSLKISSEDFILTPDWSEIHWNICWQKCKRKIFNDTLKMTSSDNSTPPHAVGLLLTPGSQHCCQCLG